EACAAPTVEIPPGGDSAPARIVTPQLESVRHEIARARMLVAGLSEADPRLELVVSGNGNGPYGSGPFLELLLKHTANARLAPLGKAPTNLRPAFDPHERLARQFKEMAEYSQHMVDDGPRI